MSGARSVCLSLWKVDDTATALLMDLGLPLRDALSAVRAARPAAGPQTAEQDALLEQYADRLGR